MSELISRRRTFQLMGLTAVGGAFMSQSAFAAETADANTAALMPGADVCVITPEVTEGPYYIDPKLVRSDITEGRPGVPTRVRLQVVDASCKPLAKARVDIWHADATGVYSGYANQTGGVDTTGQTFMRGTQETDANGIAEFVTTYPGWYRGRTTHVHFKVFIDTTNVLTGQIFFPDALSQFIYDNIAPYSGRGSDRDTINSSDSIAQQATRASFAFVKESADEYLVAMIIGVDPNAKSEDPGMPGGPGGPGNGPRTGGRRPNGSPPGGKGRPDGPPPGGASGSPSGPPPFSGGQAPEGNADTSATTALDKTKLVPGSATSSSSISK